MQNLLFEYQIQTNKSFKGRTLSVLIENKMNGTKKLFGRNKYLNSVICDGSESDVGKEVIVKVDKYNQNSLFGKVINLDTKAA